MPDSSNKDSVLLKRLKAGDTDAYSQIYTSYFAKLCRYAISLSSDKCVAEDIVQDQLMQLWLNRKTQDISSLNAYLYRSVYNKYVNIHAKEKRSYKLQDQLRYEAVLEVESAPDSLNKERLALLKRIIDKLPKKRKEIFILSKFGNYRYKEIAAMRNISERTVESQIRKALITIREEIAKLKSNGNLTVLFFLKSFL